MSDHSDDARFNGWDEPCSPEFIVELIAHTKTDTGLSIEAVLDTNTYEKGRVVTKQEFAALLLTRQEFHGEWNYTQASRTRPA